MPVRGALEGAGSLAEQMFATYELAREFNGGLDSGKSSRRPLPSETLGGYYEGWIDGYRTMTRTC